MTTITLEGNDRERGIQQGQQTASLLREGIEKFLSFSAFKDNIPMWDRLSSLRKFFYKTAVGIGSRAFQKSMKSIYPQWQKLKGISKGSQIPLKDLIFMNSIEVLMIASGCTAFAVRGKEPVAGKNFDLFTEFSRLMIIRYEMPYGKYRNINITFAHMPGSHSGMNEKGLFITYNYGMSIEKIGKGKPLISMLLQEILENYATVQESIEFLENQEGFSNGANLLMADSKGDFAVVEITPSEMAVRRHPEYIVASNHYIELEDYNIDPEAKYHPPAPKFLIGKNISHSNIARYERVKELIEETLSKRKKFTIEDAKRILRDHGRKNKPDEDTVCRHYYTLGTMASIIALPKKKEIHILFGYPCQNEYTVFKPFG